MSSLVSYHIVSNRCFADIRDPKEAKDSRGINRDSARHQAIFSIDYVSWKKLIKAYGIKEPLIPHREAEAQQVGARSWYG